MDAYFLGALAANMASGNTHVRPRDPRDLYQRALGAPIPKAMVATDANPKRRRIPRGSRPNSGIELEYRERLQRLVAEMASSVLYWTKASYRQNEPVMVKLAMDRKTAAERISEAFAKLSKRWQRKFDEAAPRLARWFATAASKRSDITLQRILRDGGFSVRFTMTPAARDIIDAAVAENVSLIRSIPQEYLTQVEGAVMRSVRQGRDLGPLAKELRSQYGVTKRRAALIARDQNNKATADMTRARQVEKGYKAIWRHSHAGKVPRRTHVANDGKTYDPVKGWYDPDEKKLIWPGTLINCRCFSQTIIPGFVPDAHR
jgi:uncharacterized protein with gpF-like domain